MADTTDTLISAILTEHSDIRQQIRACQNSQFIIVGILASTSGLLFSLGMEYYADNEMYAVKWIYIVLFPATVLLLGIIWLDQAYRLKRASCYSTLLEVKINKLLDRSMKDMSPALYWEEWLLENTSTGGFFTRVDKYYYYVMLGLFFSLPACSIWFGMYCHEYNHKGCEEYLAFTGLVILIYILFFKSYVQKIHVFQEKMLGLHSERPKIFTSQQ